MGWGLIRLSAWHVVRCVLSKVKGDGGGEVTAPIPLLLTVREEWMKRNRDGNGEVDLQLYLVIVN